MSLRLAELPLNLGLDHQLYACLAAALVAGMYAIYSHAVAATVVSAYKTAV